VKWLALDSAKEFGALYQSGEWYIRHYSGKDELGFGIECARVYRCVVVNTVRPFAAEFTGESALSKAQAYAKEREGEV
jgi:hypothetical protein